jgi:hypothetical protein
MCRGSSAQGAPCGALSLGWGCMPQAAHAPHHCDGQHLSAAWLAADLENSSQATGSHAGRCTSQPCIPLCPPAGQQQRCSRQALGAACGTAP